MKYPTITKIRQRILNKKCDVFPAEVVTHLGMCPDEFARAKAELGQIQRIPVPSRGEDYGPAPHPAAFNFDGVWVYPDPHIEHKGRLFWRTRDRKVS